MFTNFHISPCLIKKGSGKQLIALFTGLMALALLSAPGADAASRYKLKCKGPYQVVQGNLISTPPCEEAHLAKVARSYGFKVSVKQVRNNPNKKVYLCQMIGHDIRLSGICDGYKNPGPSFGGR